MLRVGPFRLEYLLGQGGMGKVYRAVHETMGHAVALKAVDPERVDLSSGRSVLGAEVRAMARLDHPGIARVFAHGVCGPDDALANGTSWYATELLSSVVHRHTASMDWDALHKVLDRLLDALAHAHARGVIHRDLKASNVLVGLPSDDRPGPRIVDFGIAASGRDSLRRAGSPSTMAPEQALDDLASIGPWTDLYAFGALAWRLLTGSSPFEGATGHELDVRKAQARLPPFRSWRACPDHVQVWLRTCLAPRPGDRYPSAAVARAALARRTVVATTWPTDEPEPLPRRLAALGASLVAVRNPMLGARAHERDAMWSAWLRASTQHRSQHLCLTGDEGVGATALGRAWVERVHTHSAAVTAWATAHPGHAEDASLQDVVDALLQPFGTPRCAAGRRRALQRLRIHDPSRHLRAIDTATTLPARVDAVAQLIEALAERTPVALFFDDAHLDPGLGLLASRLQDLPSPIVVLTRVHEAVGGVEAIEVQPLATRDLSAILARLLPLTSAVHAAVIEASCGSPAVLRRHLLQLRPHLVPTARGFDHPLPLPEPDTHDAFLQALSADDLADLMQGAVLGRDVPLAVWAQATGRSPAHIDALLDRLEAWGWVAPKPTGLTLPSTLTAALRARARATGVLATLALRGARALRVLGGDALAEGRCWRDAGQADEAVRAWVDRWRELVFRHGPQVVLGTLMEAEELLAPLPPDEGLHGRRDTAELSLRSFQRDPNHAQRAQWVLARAETQGWHDTALRAIRSLARARDIDPARATEVYERAHADRFERCSGSVQAEFLLGWYHQAERFAHANRDALFEELARRVPTCDDPHVRGQWEVVLTHRRLHDGDPSAIDSARRAVAHAQEHSPTQLFQRWWLLSTAYQQQGRMTEAEQACHEMAAAAQWLGQPQGHAWAIANLAGLAAIDGRWDEAARRAERARAASDQPYIGAVMQLICAVPFARRGRWGEIRALWREVEEHVPAVRPFDPEVVAALDALLALAEAEAHPMADNVRRLRLMGDA